MRSLLLVFLFLAACRAPRATGAAHPYVLVLGTAQDGGLPQIACECENCARARSEPAFARLGSSLLLVDPRDGRRWLFDASPALPAQVELARGHGAERVPAAGRPALFDGIFLTHAHIGHYAGLLHLGREAYGSATTPLHLSPRFAKYLASNGPWSLLVDAGHVSLEPFEVGQAVELAEDLSVTPLRVPHRDEFSDTVGFRITGPRTSLLYLPDIDKWERWSRDLGVELARVEHALIDGTFYDAAELPGRDMSEIPHPFIVETLELFSALPSEVRARVVFTHLNHSNPVTDTRSTAARHVEAAGARVAARGMRFEL